MVYQTKCTYKCRTGFQREGNENITCRLEKTWAPLPHPTCKGKLKRNWPTSVSGGYSQKNREGVCGPLPKHLKLFMTKLFPNLFMTYSGRRDSLTVSALVSGSSGPGSTPGRVHHVVFLGKTLYSHSASLHPGI